MMRSLYSGISGLKNHQTRMDVIANNIANVNTDGFKASRVVFQDVYSQTVRLGAAGTAGSTTPAVAPMGGTNTSQIGLGLKLSAVDVLYTNSAPKRTDKELDLMIDGDGFFIVNTNGVVTGTTPPPGTEYFTRAGNFDLDNLGRVVTSDGLFVMGYLNTATPPANPGDPIPAPSFPASPAAKTDLSIIDLSAYTGIGIDDQGVIWGLDANDNRVAVAKVALATFSNNGGLEKKGGSLYAATGATGTTRYTAAKEAGVGKVLQGALEMSNVDLATEFTDMIVTQRGFQANSRIITTSDTMLEELVNLKR